MSIGLDRRAVKWRTAPTSIRGLTEDGQLMAIWSAGDIALISTASGQEVHALEAANSR